MNRIERTEQALDHVHAAKKALHESDVEGDSAMQRKLDSRAALHLRKAADLLDDDGRLSEE